MDFSLERPLEKKAACAMILAQFGGQGELRL
jgi:hypothetical protein